MSEPKTPNELRVQLLPRLDPHAALGWEAGPQTRSGVPRAGHHHLPRRGRYLELRQALLAFKADHRHHKRLAVVFMGGGARGPYEGGVVEALVQEFHALNIEPDVVCGASVGAINSLCMFVDAMFPRSTPDPNTHFLARQSDVWRSLGAGADGAQRVVDKPWLVEFVTKKRPIPGLGDLEDAISKLSAAWTQTKTDVAALGPAGQALADALTTVDTGQILSDVQSAASSISGDMSSIQNDWNGITNAWASVDLTEILTNPDDFVNEIEALASAIGTMTSDLPGLVLDLVTSAARIAGDDVQALFDYIAGVVGAVERLLNLLGQIVLDSGDLVGDLALVELWLGVLLAVGLWILTNLEWLFIVTTTAAGATVMLADHVLANTRIIGLMSQFVQGSMMAAGAQHSRIVDEWKARHNAGKKVPAFYISTTNLTADRLMIFALDDPAHLSALANDGTWVVDLAGQAPLDLNLFHVRPDSEQDPLVRACMTSSSVPFAFPPITWHLRHMSDATVPVEEDVSHVFVDGGVVDNTPIDLAVFADATHVISVELTPLLDYTDVPTTDTAMDNLVGVGERSFFTAMDGSLLRSISDVVFVNAQLPPSKQMHIYRLAPLLSKDATATDGTSIQITPGLLNFDGVFNDNHRLTMNLFDWFIQGYIDAKGFTGQQQASASTSDPILASYFNAPASAEFLTDTPQFSGNRLWETQHSPLPTRHDLTTAGITDPDRTALADTAEHR